ncbi:recombinational repair protein, putative [Theileria equi strain WA]|uniref:Recombinational repair protein, putative n=1 Tax=Theileria equi strain WA TaxID=1537102 RepID=L1LEN7_THEEQ|nr:recombinational repair protein, putative [Theileria equi strain WA]EKX73897.1 recombinational repair protein, putative [Theileria equi strain WA]|eukprot:XP_004833349.1 recombinational repair protein, putative [Theileria equi strain WA]
MRRLFPHEKRLKLSNEETDGSIPYSPTNVCLIRAPILSLLSVEAGPVVLLKPFKSPLEGHTPGLSEESQRKTLGCRIRGVTKSFLRDFRASIYETKDEALENLPPDNPLTLYTSPPEDEVQVVIKVDSMLSRFLRDHQRQGVQFIFDCLMGLKEFNGRGCILADDMGLGKTLQSITVMWTLLKQGFDNRPGLKCSGYCKDSTFVTAEVGDLQGTQGYGFCTHKVRFGLLIDVIGYGGTELNIHTNGTSYKPFSESHGRLYEITTYYSTLYDKDTNVIKVPLIIAVRDYLQGPYKWFENTGDSITWKNINQSGDFPSSDTESIKPQFRRKLNDLTCTLHKRHRVDMRQKPPSYKCSICGNATVKVQEGALLGDLSIYKKFGHTPQYNTGDKYHLTYEYNEVRRWENFSISYEDNVKEVTVNYWEGDEDRKNPLLINISLTSGISQWYENVSQDGRNTSWRPVNEQVIGDLSNQNNLRDRLHLLNCHFNSVVQIKFGVTGCHVPKDGGHPERVRAVYNGELGKYPEFSAYEYISDDSFRESDDQNNKRWFKRIDTNSWVETKDDHNFQGKNPLQTKQTLSLKDIGKIPKSGLQLDIRITPHGNKEEEVYYDTNKETRNIPIKVIKTKNAPVRGFFETSHRPAIKDDKTFVVKHLLKDGGKIGTGNNVSGVEHFHVYFWDGAPNKPILLGIKQNTITSFRYYGEHARRWKFDPVSGMTEQEALDDQNCMVNKAIPIELTNLEDLKGFQSREKPSNCLNGKNIKIDIDKSFFKTVSDLYTVDSYKIPPNTKVSRVTFNKEDTNITPPYDENTSKFRIYKWSNSDTLLLVEFVKENGESMWYENLSKNSTDWKILHETVSNVFYDSKKCLTENLTKKLNEVNCLLNQAVTIDLTKTNSSGKVNRGYCCTYHTNGQRRVSVTKNSVQGASTIPYFKHEIGNTSTLAGIKYYENGGATNRKRISSGLLGLPISGSLTVYTFYCKGNSPVLIYIHPTTEPSKKGWFKKRNGTNDWERVTSGLPNDIPENIKGCSDGTYDQLVRELGSVGCTDYGTCPKPQLSSQLGVAPGLPGSGSQDQLKEEQKTTEPGAVGHTGDKGDENDSPFGARGSSAKHIGNGAGVAPIVGTLPGELLERLFEEVVSVVTDKELQTSLINLGLAGMIASNTALEITSEALPQQQPDSEPKLQTNADEVTQPATSDSTTPKESVTPTAEANAAAQSASGLSTYEMSPDSSVSKNSNSTPEIIVSVTTGILAARKCAIICPASLVSNWESEIKKWLRGKCPCTAIADSGREKVISAFEGFKYDNNSRVLISSYETYRMHCARLQGVPIDLIICDEAHRLKNDKTQTSLSISSSPAKMRLMLSGTPIQNDLNEFYSLISLCNPDVLGDVNNFRRCFANPILIGREPDATPEQQRMAGDRLAELSHITNQFVLRRTNVLLSKVLPPKIILNVFCNLTDIQKTIYKSFVNSKRWKNIIKDEGVFSRTLTAIQSLMKLCNHPLLIKRGGLLSTPDVDDLFENIELASKNNKHKCCRCDLSGKILVLYRLLYHIRKNGNDRVVIISNYTQTLDIFERLCRECNYPFVRLDGTISIKKRHKLVTTFNDPTTNSFIFLLSSKAGGCGINLIGANRLVLFDPDWNPANDKQALARVWRDGQKKVCYIYRFFSTGTIEEKIYQRQICKDGLSSMLVTDGINELKDSLSGEELKNLFDYKDSILSDTHDTIDCTRCNRGEETVPFVPQEREVLEEDLNTWAHHTDLSTVPDEFLVRAALRNEPKSPYPEVDIDDKFVPISFVMSCRIEFNTENANMVATEKNYEKLVRNETMTTTCDIESEDYTPTDNDILTGDD